jgi:hypothetical protein
MKVCLQFQKIKPWMSQIVNGCNSCGFIQTIAGRKRYLPDIQSKIQAVKKRAERQAINAVIQVIRRDSGNCGEAVMVIVVMAVVVVTVKTGDSGNSGDSSGNGDSGDNRDSGEWVQ